MYIYGILSTILFLILLPFYYIIRVLNRKFLYGWKEKLGFFKNPSLGEKVIMLHGVSVGEVIALENLTKKIKETFPDYKIVITTGTKTGQDIAHKKYENIADFITYFPFDIPLSQEIGKTERTGNNRKEGENRKINYESLNSISYGITLLLCDCTKPDLHTVRLIGNYLVYM